MVLGWYPARPVFYLQDGEMGYAEGLVVLVFYLYKRSASWINYWIICWIHDVVWVTIQEL